jgi:hypothetical protein
MATCETCGNEYDRYFESQLGCETQAFDSFDRAFYTVAPRCAHCGCRIVGCGIEVKGIFFCCAHCANAHPLPVIENRI